MNTRKYRSANSNPAGGQFSKGRVDPEIPGRYEGLFSETELLDQLAITGQVMLLQVIQQTLALSYQLHQAAVGGKILFVLLKMATDLADPFGKEGDLTFNGAGIFLVSGEICEN